MNEIKETIKDLILTEKLDSTSVVKSQRRIMKRMKTFAPSKMSLLKAYHEMTFKEKKTWPNLSGSNIRFKEMKRSKNCS